MTTSLRGVACSYEGLKCYHVLRLLADNDDGIAVFQPSLVEHEIFRFLRAIAVLPESTAAATSQPDLLGKYLNENVLAGTRHSMDVMAYFGKQSAVQHQLTVDGWWPRTLSKYIELDEEGVYALSHGSATGHTDGLRVVLFAWLTDTSFESKNVRERATYVLRFLTSLTSNVVCCLTKEDAAQGKIVAPSRDGVASDKKYSMSFSIQTAKVQEEKVTCLLKHDGGWGSMFEGGLLMPSNVVSLVMVKLDRNVRSKQSKEPFSDATGFAAWLTEVMTTHFVDVNCQLPRPWMASALKLNGAFPKDHLDNISKEAIESALWIDAEAKMLREMSEFRDRCIENAAYAFYVKIESPKKEETACEALELDIAKLRNWNLAIDRHTSQQLVHFQDELLQRITDVWSRSPSPAAPKGFWSSFRNNIRTYFTSSHNALLEVPILEEGNDILPLLNSMKEYLKHSYENWCRLLENTLAFPELAFHITRMVYMDMLPYVNVEEMVKNRKEEVIRDAFAGLVATKNHNQPSQLHISLKAHNAHRNELSYMRQDFDDKAQIAAHFEVAQTSPALRGRFVLPAKSKILFMCRYDDISVVVYVKERAGSMETHVKSFKKENELHTRTFPKETILCDFDPGHRLLALLHSTTAVEVYAFNESYKVLERVYAVNLDILRLQSPFIHLLVFGGDNHGIAVVDHLARLQYFFFRSKQMSTLVENVLVADNSKLVKVEGGAMLLLLTKTTQDTTEYCVLVQTMLTVDNTMLPEAELRLPISMDWSGCSVVCVNDSLVCFDPITTRVRMWTVDIVTGKTAWQLQRSQKTRGVENAMEAHPLWSLFHLFEKFPVQSLVAKSTSDSLVSGHLRLHVCGLANEPAISGLLAGIMQKLRGLNKNLAPLDLVADLTMHGSSAVPWHGTSVVMAKWVLELAGFVPVQICRARDNQLVLLKNGVEEASNG
ncbi:hypothetical protein As57867_020710, partial [Aphanomyces stellatus]